MQGFLISSLLFIRSVPQTANSEEATTMHANRQSNFVAIGDRNRAKNSHEKSEFILIRTTY